MKTIKNLFNTLTILACTVFASALVVPPTEQHILATEQQENFSNPTPSVSSPTQNLPVTTPSVSSPTQNLPVTTPSASSPTQNLPIPKQHVSIPTPSVSIPTPSVSNSSANPSAESIIGKHIIRFAEPPKRIPSQYAVDAPLLGNGFVGVAIAGTPDKQIFYTARNDFWRLKTSYQQGYPAVLGLVELSIPKLKGGSYLIEQKLFDAMTFAQFKKDNMTVFYKAFVAATDDVLVIELRLEGQGELEGNVRLVAPPVLAAFPEKTEITPTKDGITTLARAFTESVDIPTQAAIALKTDNKKDGNFVLSAGKTVRFICTFDSNFKSDNCTATAIRKAREIDDAKLSELENEHKKWWKDYWEKSFVAIPDKEIERQYYLSLYGMGACSRDKNFPPPIFGTWNTKEVPVWSGDYHLNYNHNAPFYALYSANRIEQAEPYYAPLLAFIDRGHYYSEKVTGIPNGILLPVGIGPLGIETTRVAENENDKQNPNGNTAFGGMFWGQKSNSAYAVVNLSMQFYHTYDKDFTKKVYPFVHDVAAFWEGYLKFENGRYVIYNDSVHEGSLGTMNAILSLGLVHLVMQTVKDMSILLNVDADKREKWTHIQKHLSKYPTQERNGKTIFRLSEKGLAWYSSNTLGIQHIYPAGQIGLESSAELLEIARNTIQAKQRWHDTNGSNSFFPATVRVGFDSEVIWRELSKYSQHTYPNGFQQGNPHGIENWSTVPNTVNEMLCTGHQGVVRIFPVRKFGTSQDAFFHRIRVEGAFLVTSKLQNGEVTDLSIQSEQGRVLNLQNPWKDKKIRIKKIGGNEKSYEGDRIKIPTEPKATYHITPILELGVIYASCFAGCVV